MNNRNEFNKKGEEILNFFDIYDVVRQEHLEKFFPNSKKVIKHLLKNRRLHVINDGNYLGAEQDTRSDKCMIAALGVLADIIEKVQHFAKATAPIQISFVSHSGDCYEIIYVGHGMEAMVTATLEAQQQQQSYAVLPKRMVIIENQSQMTRLQIPGITRFALVQPDGSLSYFKGG
jgi:hypothetical protein